MSPGIVPFTSEAAALVSRRTSKLAPVPKPAARSAEELRRVSREYSFGPNFYQPNVRVRVEPRDGYLALRYPSFTSPLTPIDNGVYFDRFYWSFIRFEEGRLIYRNGHDEFVATSVPAPGSP